jgi:hypothetical protein
MDQTPSQLEAAGTSCVICPICGLDDTQTEFGICRARNSGKNLYCKTCIRAKSNNAREALRSYRKNRRCSLKSAPKPDRNHDGILQGKQIKNRKLPHHERVLGAIHAGARTQKEILNAILPKGGTTSLDVESPRLTQALDLIGDSLAILLAHPRCIQIETVNGIRVFKPVIPQRKADQVSPGSYRSLSGLMSARRRWRAA